jgi:hypothetical protein
MSSENNILRASLQIPTNRPLRRSDIAKLVDIAKSDGDVSMVDKDLIGETVLQAKDKQGLTKKASAYYSDLVEKDGYFKLKNIRASINGGP